MGKDLVKLNLIIFLNGFWVVGNGQEARFESMTNRIDLY